MASVIEKYFELSDLQCKQFETLPDLYKHWNAQINVISRKDIDAFEIRHALHALAIAKLGKFVAGSKVLDVGTGGGFPGIPLAILMPDVQFFLVDSIGKKIKVVNAVAEELQLSNVIASHQRAEDVYGKFDFVVSRAVTRMLPFLNWVERKFEAKTKENQPFKNGILYLKGGDLTEELAETARPYQLFSIADLFDDPFFETKKVVYMPMV